MGRASHHKSLLPCSLLAVSLLLGLAQSVQAQGGFAVEDVKVVYNFGEQITFQVRLPSAAGVTQASVLFRESAEEVTRIEALTLEEDGAAHFTYDARLNVLPPFSTIVFWFQAVLANGATETSPVFYFRYEDNRFPWQQLSDGGLSVHWYDGDHAFGQAALDSARAGLSATRQLLSLNLDSPLDVYVYSSSDDLQGALFLGGKEWTGGHADPSLGVAMVAITPGEAQAIEMQTEIPHELAHVLLYRDMGESYSRLPAWLSEGVASMVEGYPKPDYANALTLASQNDSLIPFTDLCGSFPPDSGRAFLAYAQSQSFARYLRDTYGWTGLAALLRAYADGLNCELGAARAVGVPLSQLDTRWRESVLGQNVAGVALRNLAPYLVVMALALLIPLWGVVKMAGEKRKYEHQST
jgi:hypothetical protein